MRPKDNLRIYIYLIVAWLALIVMQHFSHTYLKKVDILIYANDSLAPIPIIVLVVVFLFGFLVESRENRSRKQQLMFIKSLMFRLELRNLYIANFLALQSPALDFATIKTASLAELKAMRVAAEVTEYKSLEAMESVIAEYAKAQDVWRSFMDIARANGFKDIFHDMLYVMHFIGDFITFKEVKPDSLFIHEAANDEASMRKVMKVLGDGIRKYLEYVIELKEKQPELFNQVLADYELLARARG
jgi:hypothetical protein